MIKRIKEKPLGYLRPITHDVMFCDGEGCGQRIRFSSASDGRHLCEECYQKSKGAKSVSKVN